MTAPPKLYRLVTLQEAKWQLRIIGNDEDAIVDMRVINSSQIIMNYLKRSPFLHGWCDTSGIPLVDINGDPLRIGAIGTLDSNGDFQLTLNSNGDPVNAGISIVPGMVREACLLDIALSDADAEGEKQRLSGAVESLLMRFRDPAVA